MDGAAFLQLTTRLSRRTHQPHPLQRVFGLQALRHAGLRRHFREHPFQPLVRGLLDLQQVRIHAFGQDQLVPEQGPVLLQVLFPHPPIFPYGLGGLMYGQVRNQILAVLVISQFLHGVLLSVGDSFGFLWGFL